MRAWLITFVSGRTETITGDRLCEDRTLLKIHTDPTWVTVVLANVETYREVTP